MGSPIIIEAKISIYFGKQQLKVSTNEPGNVETADLKISDRMVATLIGGSAFDVSPSGPQEQWVSDVEPTTWTWQVTPKIVGDQVLMLSFDAIISINDKDGRRTVNTLERHIKVGVGWPETVTEWLDVVKKTDENVSWIWLSLVLPIGAPPGNVISGD
jgi:hypothetical protein